MNKDEKMKERNENTSLHSLNNEQILHNLSVFISKMDDLDEMRFPQKAYTIIKKAVRNLILPPGKTFLEREVAETLEMSRTPVREALVRLEMEDALQIIPRRGFFIEPIEKNDLSDIYQMVAALDGLAIELSTDYMNDEEVSKLDALINSQEEALEKEDFEEWAILDDEFHNTIIKFSKNDNLNKVIENYTDKLYKARLYTINYRPSPAMSIVEHKAMVACIRAKDKKAAKMVMESHRKRAQQEILNALDEINN
jgi:DNA-binding GntR family transcriptional regulator